MIIVGVDTSTRQGSVALVANDEVVDQEESSSPESFSRTLLVMIDKLLSRNHGEIQDIDGFGIAVGPGSFTGIRIGLATLSGICLSRSIPVYGVSTLEAIALSSCHSGPGTIIPMLDAGQENAYFASFKKNGRELERLSPDRVAEISEIAKEAEANTLTLGDGAEVYREQLSLSGVGIMESNFCFSTSAGVGLLAEKMALANVQSDIYRIKPNYMHRGSIKNYPLTLEG